MNINKVAQAIKKILASKDDTNEMRNILLDLKKNEIGEVLRVLAILQAAMQKDNAPELIAASLPEYSRFITLHHVQ